MVVYFSPDFLGRCLSLGLSSNALIELISSIKSEHKTFWLIDPVKPQLRARIRSLGMNKEIFQTIWPSYCLTPITWNNLKQKVTLSLVYPPNHKNIIKKLLLLLYTTKFRCFLFVFVFIFKILMWVSCR